MIYKVNIMVRKKSFQIKNICLSVGAEQIPPYKVHKMLTLKKIIGTTIKTNKLH